MMDEILMLVEEGKSNESWRSLYEISKEILSAVKRMDAFDTYALVAATAFELTDAGESGDHDWFAAAADTLIETLKQVGSEDIIPTL